MIITSNGSPRPLDAAALRSMFEARKQVFVDLLGWDVPIVEDKYEIDQFDDEHAYYLMIADERGDHLGSARLLPTNRPHLLGDLFPELCAGTVPQGDDVEEITRFCLGRNQNAAGRRATRNMLVSALVRSALERGIHQFTGVAELSWLQQILSFGWQCRPLGTPRRIGSSMIGALAIDITPETPALLAANNIWIDVEPRHLQILEAA